MSDQPHRAPIDSKAAIRAQLRGRMAELTEEQRRAAGVSACNFLTATPEFTSAGVVMIFLSTPQEIDTTPLALKCWQAGKTTVVPKVSWNQRRMLPVEINSLQTGLTTNERGILEPIEGKPIPTNLIDLVIVPGIGFTPNGHRIGRGMGFYDRFLALPDFNGVSCGLAFEEQVVPSLPVLDHDIPLCMLVTDKGVRRFASSCIEQSEF